VLRLGNALDVIFCRSLLCFLNAAPGGSHHVPGRTGEPAPGSPQRNLFETGIGLRLSVTYLLCRVQVAGRQRVAAVGGVGTGAAAADRGG